MKVMYQAGDFWVGKAGKGYGVYENGTVASVRQAFYPMTGAAGVALTNAMNEAGRLCAVKLYRQLKESGGRLEFPGLTVRLVG